MAHSWKQLQNKNKCRKKKDLNNLANTTHGLGKVWLQSPRQTADNKIGHIIMPDI